MEAKRLDEAIILFDETKTIEAYDFKKEITFSGLVNELIKREFVCKIDFVDKVENKTEQELNLIKFIKGIIDDYNSKVEIFTKETNG